MNNKELEMKAQEHDVSDVSAEAIAETTKAVAEEAVTGYKKIEKCVVDGYKKIEDGVVSGYKKIEDGVVEGFGKVVDKCVEVLFAQEGESVEDAKARLSGEEKKQEQTPADEQ